MIYKNISVKQHILLSKLLMKSQNNKDSSFKSNFYDPTAAFGYITLSSRILTSCGECSPSYLLGSKIPNSRWWLSSTKHQDPQAIPLATYWLHTLSGSSFWLWCSGVYISSALPATSPTGLTHCLSALFLTPWLINFQDFFKILCWLMPLWVCLCLYLEYPFWHTLFPLRFLYLDSAASVKTLCGLPKLD